FPFHDFRSGSRYREASCRNWLRCRGFPKRLATNFALDDRGIVVGPAHRAEDEVENVLFLLRGSLGLRLEFRRASRTFRVPRADESAAIRVDEQEADFSLREDSVRI